MKWKSDFKEEKWFQRTLFVIFSPLILIMFIAIGATWVTDKIHLFLIDKFGVSIKPHEWFAWYPVTYSTWSESHGQVVWLEKVWRARSSKRISGYVAYGSSKEDLENILD